VQGAYASGSRDTYGWLEGAPLDGLKGPMRMGEGMTASG